VAVEIGLFPLGVVLLPGERLPLHIFEPRYLELVSECIEQRATFGLVLGGEDDVREVGTHASVVEVLHRNADGRFDILVEGGERFRILEETSGRAYRTASIEPVEDDEEQPSPGERSSCLSAFRVLLEEVGEEAFDPEPRDEGLAFWIAARVDFGVEARQELLELTSERSRVRMLTRNLTRASRGIRYGKLAHERAGGNGRVEPPS
jgi:Lon protease-like protein